MKLILFTLTLFFIPKISSAIVEFDLSVNYSKQVYGDNRENLQETKSYAVSWAWYFTGYSALEFSFSDGLMENSIVQEATISGTNLKVTGTLSEVVNKNYTVGLKQALAPQSRPIRPMISIGYAKQTITSVSTYLIDDNGTSLRVVLPEEELSNDSVFASASFKLEWEVD